MESGAEVKLKQDQELQDNDLVKLAKSCREKIVYYFEQLRNFCLDFSSEVIFHAGFVDRLKDLSNNILAELPVYVQNDELIQNNHYQIVKDENFAIGLANFCVKHHVNIISKIQQRDVIYFIDYIDLLLNSYFERLFNASSPPDQKILIRSWLIKDLNRTSCFELKGMIYGIDELPPYQLSQRRLELFVMIQGSRVISQSIDKFIQDTLEKGSAPFHDPEEGKKLIYDTLAWVITSPNVLFAKLLATTHGFSSDSYLFINFSYDCSDDLNEAMRLLTLVHECFHIYKRLWNNNLVRSPINSFIIPGETEHRGEDGHRFMEFLLPNKGTVLYADAARLLCRPENWAFNLIDFQLKFNESQQHGETHNSPSLMFFENSGYGQWPICFKDPTLDWLRR